MKVSELVGKYMDARERKAQLKAEYEMKTARLDEVMAKIESKFLQVMQETGMESIRTEFGTVYSSVRTSASIADREAFMEYIRSNEEWPLLEVKASKTAVKEYREIHNDLPPGVNWREERIVGVRRSA